MALDQENYLSDGTDPRLPRKQAEIEAQAEDQHTTEVAKKRAEYEDLQRRHRAMMDAMAANTKSMFGKTPPEVSVNAMALAVEEAHQLAALRQLEGQQADDPRDIRAFSAQIRGREVAFYYEGRQKPSFVDDGKNIYVPDFNEDAALLASLQLAQQRWGVVKITGTDDFKERVVQMAVDHNLKLSNRDLAEMVRARREAEGILSAPSEEERRAAEEFHASAAENAAPAAPAAKAEPAPASPKAEAQPEDEEVNEASLEPEAAPAVPDSPVATDASKPEPAPVATAQADAPQDDKAWILEIQEERRLRKEAAMQAQKEAETEEVVADTESAVANIVFDEDVPEEEIDLGMGDDDDFDPLATADPVPPSSPKNAGVGVRP